MKILPLFVIALASLVCSIANAQTLDKQVFVGKTLEEIRKLNVDDDGLPIQPTEGMSYKFFNKSNKDCYVCIMNDQKICFTAFIHAYTTESLKKHIDNLNKSWESTGSFKWKKVDEHGNIIEVEGGEVDGFDGITLVQQIAQ